MKYFIISFFSLTVAHASLPEFELAQTSEAFTQTLNASTVPFSLEGIRVRTVLEAGVEIPLISDFTLAPEVELYFSSK